ncbi:carboxylating nicotinate-nucleotide diphosphorylase [Candidatus Alkanophaga liquidiphilum]|nr:Nicotinate-nucleotide pyrophosphorylase [Candidatus Alkanophaga liquidiphilum]
MLLSELEWFLREDLEGVEVYPFMPPEVAERECIAEVVLGSERCVLAGLAEAMQVFEYFGVRAASQFKDGAVVGKGQVILRVEGTGVGVLSAERLALNFLGKMSGIATLTAEFVRAARQMNERVRIAGTRKTTPGFRKYEKKAVLLGGGDPHRLGLYDAIIIKDNHLKLMSLEDAVREARRRCSFTRKIEVEVESVEDAVRAAELGVDIIMLDNMTASEVRRVVEELQHLRLREKVILEVSGEITLENVVDFAAAGVDVISIGMLTHSAKAINFSLEIVKVL